MKVSEKYSFDKFRGLFLENFDERFLAEFKINNCHAFDENI